MLFTRELARTDGLVSDQPRPAGKPGLRKEARTWVRKAKDRSNQRRTAKGRSAPTRGDRESGEQGRGLRQAGWRGLELRACAVHRAGVQHLGRPVFFGPGPNSRNASRGTPGSRTAVHRIQPRIGERRSGLRRAGRGRSGQRRPGQREAGPRRTGERRSGAREASDKGGRERDHAESGMPGPAPTEPEAPESKRPCSE